MGVRVKVEVEYGERRVTTTALLNTGYESDVPEILIPLSVAEQLGIWPNLPKDATAETYRTASGLMSVYRIPRGKVRLVLEEGVGSPVEAYIVVAEYTDEVLVSDQLISALRIVIEDPARGLWRLRGETRIRESVRGA